ncbi:MAG: hypothetical protein IT577_14040 [Verrucomicrobiae bacterium]|nr:hypothetical protein [Verrucomicrobiae bacterium]
MVKRLLTWIAGLLRPKVAGPLGDVRLVVTGADGKTREHRVSAGRSRREPIIKDYCVLERGEHR